jgi:hypothetical protein
MLIPAMVLKERGPKRLKLRRQIVWSFKENSRETFITEQHTQGSLTRRDEKFPRSLLLAAPLIVVILSEVAKATKVQEKLGVRRARFFCLWLCFLYTLPAAAAPFAEPVAQTDPTAPANIIKPDPSEQLDRLNDCNWIVTYRGRTYDLAPLTREALARPLETDIRYALQRVPEANEHLDAMGTSLRNARAHSKIASVFLAGLLAAQLLKGGAEKHSDRARTFSIISIGSGAFSLAGFLSSWKATRDAKRELVQAVTSFNEKSPYKIEPSTSGRANLDAPLDSVLPGAGSKELEDAEKNRP